MTASRRPPLLRLVLAVVGAVVVVLSPAAVVAAARRDAVGQEREPCVVDRAEEVVVADRRVVGDRRSDQPMTFSGRLGPRGRTTNICSATFAEASVLLAG